MIFRTFLIGAILSLPMPALASRSYQATDYLLRTVEAKCLGERIFVSYLTWHRLGSEGLKEIRVGKKRVPAADLRAIEARLEGRRLIGVSIDGCRRTRNGDVRVWFSVQPDHPDPTRGKFSVSQSFYVRNGRVEFHVRQPVD